MAEKEVKLMKGNEAIAHALIRCGADAFFGYPITPQTEIIETLSALKPWETTGMVVVQAESEVASINMVYGGAGAGKRCVTTSSSPGVSLMQEGISYMAGAEIPGVIVNVQRGGPGLGTIQPSQSDYFQSTRGGGNGDYYVIVLAPNSVQEMADFVDLSFELAFKYRCPAMILSDGVIGQMMEKVVLPDEKPRLSDEEVKKRYPWATFGRTPDRDPNIMTSLELKPEVMEERNLALQAKYEEIRNNEVRYETQQCEDADYIIVKLRFCSPYRREGHGVGPRGRPEGRSLPSNHLVAVPDQADRGACQEQEGYPRERVQRRPDGRGCPLGSQWCHPRGALRPPGWYRSFTRGDC